MVCRVELVAEVRAWLGGLRVSDPVAAGFVDDALSALADEGAALGPPLVVAVESPGDPEAGLDDWYQRRLQRLQEMRRGLADVATSRQRADLLVGDIEASIATLDARLQGALGQADDEGAAQLRTELSERREHLATMREEQASLHRREQELDAVARRATADTDLFRIQKESIKADYVVARARAIAAEAAAADDDTSTGARPSLPAFLELRPARLGVRELRILFALHPPDTAVLLYADVTVGETPTWHGAALPAAQERYASYIAQSTDR